MLETGNCYCRKGVPPVNFSWVVDGKLAAMGCPNTRENMKYLVEQDISHLITLSAEMSPPKCWSPEITRSVISVPEFAPPTLDQIDEFIECCKIHNFRNKKVGVHCRQGKGRTGTMVACYMVYFNDLSPQRAITNVRLLRPGSIETYRQEKVVEEYHDHLRKHC